MSNLKQAMIKDEEALTKLYKQRDKVNEEIKNLEVDFKNIKILKLSFNFFPLDYGSSSTSASQRRRE